MILHWLPLLVLAPQDSRPAAPSAPAESLYSGPQVGEAVPPIKIIDVNGGRKERVFDPRQEAGDRLALYFLFTGPARPISRSIGQVDAMVREITARGERQGAPPMHTYFIGLMPDRLEGDRRLRDVWMMLEPKAPANVSLEGVEGPGAWGINKKCQLTLILAKGGKVVFNHATTSPGDADNDKIRKALSDAVGYGVTSRPAWADRMMGGGMMGGSMGGGGMMGSAGEAKGRKEPGDLHEPKDAKEPMEPGDPSMVPRPKPKKTDGPASRPASRPSVP